MDEILSTREPRSRLLRFLRRRRTRRDREFLETFSNPASVKDIHDAELAQQTSLGQNSAEGNRGISRF
jgi:hypothetical protein